MKLTEIGIHNRKSAEILNESWNTLTESQQYHVVQWEKNIWPVLESYASLMEQDLSSDQVIKVFNNAERVMNALGKNTTALGKAGKVVSAKSSKIRSEIQRLYDQSGAAGEVENFKIAFNKQYQELKKQIGDSPRGKQILNSLDTWKKYAQENPGKTAFIIGALTTMTAIAASSPAATVAVAAIMSMSNEIIKQDQEKTQEGLQDFQENKSDSLDIWERFSEYQLKESSKLQKIAKTAGKTADRISKTLGDRLGKHVSADKLISIWKKTGSPTDVASIVNILRDQGLSDEQIGLVSKNSRIDLTTQNLKPQKSANQPVDITSLAQKLRDAGLADEVKRILNPKGPEDRGDNGAEFKSKRNQPQFKTQRQKPPEFRSRRANQQPSFQSSRTASKNNPPAGLS